MNGESKSDFHIRVAHAGDLEALVAYNTSLAWETEGRQLERVRLRAGVGIHPVRLRQRDVRGGGAPAR